MQNDQPVACAFTKSPQPDAQTKKKCWESFWFVSSFMNLFKVETDCEELEATLQQPLKHSLDFRTGA